MKGKGCRCFPFFCYSAGASDVGHGMRVEMVSRLHGHYFR